MTLAVTDDDGASEPRTRSTTVDPAPPVNGADGQRRTGPDGDHRRRSEQHRREAERQRLVRLRRHDRSYTWTGSPNPADAVSPTVNSRRGTYTFNLVVTDDDGASSAADSVSITVNPAPPVNKAPTADAGPDQTVTIAAGQSNIAVKLNGSGSSDSDGSIASYTWTGSPNPADVVSPTVNLTGGQLHLHSGRHRRRRREQRDGLGDHHRQPRTAREQGADGRRQRPLQRHDRRGGELQQRRFQ